MRGRTSPAPEPGTVTARRGSATCGASRTWTAGAPTAAPASSSGGPSAATPRRRRRRGRRTWSRGPQRPRTQGYPKPARRGRWPRPRATGEGGWGGDSTGSHGASNGQGFQHPASPARTEPAARGTAPPSARRTHAGQARGRAGAPHGRKERGSLRHHGGILLAQRHGGRPMRRRIEHRSRIAASAPPPGRPGLRPPRLRRRLGADAGGEAPPVSSLPLRGAHGHGGLFVRPSRDGRTSPELGRLAGP